MALWQRLGRLIARQTWRAAWSHVFGHAGAPRSRSLPGPCVSPRVRACVREQVHAICGWLHAATCGPKTGQGMRAMPIPHLNPSFGFATAGGSTDGNAAVAAAHSITLTGSDFMSGHMSASARMQGTVTLSTPHLHYFQAPSPTLSPTDPVPRGLLTLRPGRTQANRPLEDLEDRHAPGRGPSWAQGIEGARDRV